MNKPAPDLSICIVTYQGKDLLKACLHSIYENTNQDASFPCSFEIIITDNGSTDGTVEMLRAEFQEVQTIVNDQNLGYTAPMNQALRRGNGRYLLQLNPDTLVLPGALDRLVRYLDGHPDVGICGPKVLNPDGSLQKPCRRGDPRPWAVLSYFSGLSKRFPKSRFFGEYLMSYLDEDQTHPVAGVSGSCMLIRRAVIEQIGYLDELFFAYQEDADFCFRARQANWLVVYYPEAQIIHYGGLGGSRVEPYRSIFQWHRSYYLYYRKTFAKDYFFLLNWLYYLAMLLKLLFALLANAFRKGKFAPRREPHV
jgi:GT2 family glycosyltransferase